MIKNREFLPIILILGICAIAGPACAQYGDLSNASDPQPVISRTNPGIPSQTADHIKEWFKHYDLVRHEAQMVPSERQRADMLLSKGLSIIIPGEEKAATRALLSKLVDLYQRAAEQLRQMPLFPETEKLHRGYYQYFRDARRLFTDYIKVQENLFAKDATGKPIAGTLMERKMNLEMLDQSNKQLDAHLRQKFGIAPYRY